MWCISKIINNCQQGYPCSKKDLKDNEVHSFYLSFKHSIDVIKDIKTPYAGKEDLVKYLHNILDEFKEIADTSVEEAYTGLLKTLCKDITLNLQ